MIVLANDHAGLSLKESVMEVLTNMRLPYRDIGTNSPERTDYPLWGYNAGKLVASGECDRGIVMCGSGVGISLAANKVKGIRCVVCSDCYTAQFSRSHNNANMLALGARVIGPGMAKMIVRIWLETPFTEEERHAHRIQMIADIEEGRAL